MQPRSAAGPMCPNSIPASPTAPPRNRSATEGPSRESPGQCRSRSEPYRQTAEPSVASSRESLRPVGSPPADSPWCLRRNPGRLSANRMKCLPCPYPAYRHPIVKLKHPNNLSCHGASLVPGICSPDKSLAIKRRGAEAPRWRKIAALLQQLRDFLLDAVGLRQGADAGLAQDLVLREVRGRLTVIRRLDGVLRRKNVLLLGRVNAGDRVQRVDLRTHVTALCCHVRDGGVDVGQGRLGCRCAGENVRAEVLARSRRVADRRTCGGNGAAYVADACRSKRSDGQCIGGSAGRGCVAGVNRDGRTREYLVAIEGCGCADVVD